MPKQKKHIMAIFGTRPEAIKVIPVVKALRATKKYRVSVTVTGQHREMLDQVLMLFKVRPDHDLNIMLAGQSLYDITSRTLKGLRRTFRGDQPDLVLVQGDTTTTFASALAAFYEQIPVGHIEAGLRSGDMKAPYPEEGNRVMTSRIASLHFAPTREAAMNLAHEGIRERTVYTTGNTVVDALLEVERVLSSRKLSSTSARISKWASGRKIVLVTAHRRENWGQGIRSICKAVAEIAAHKLDVCFVFSVHRNPAVRGDVHALLDKVTNVKLTEPVGYIGFIELMQLSHIILSDSGGVQEEAPSLKRPVLVLRDVTERPEGLKAGVTKLVGTNSQTIVKETLRLLNDPRSYKRMTTGKNPYGDGKSSERIVKAIDRYLNGGGGSR